LNFALLTIFLLGSNAYNAAADSNPHTELLRVFMGEEQTLNVSHIYSEELAPFIKDMDNKKGGSETAWLKKVYRETHKLFLKNYQQYASFEDIFSSGNYDCLTGTALYAMIFESLGVKYKIYETNYHVFILLQTIKGDVLIESTDPHNGFIANQQLINQKLEEYRQLKSDELENSDKSSYEFKHKIFRETNLKELVGLLNFNAAVLYYNKGKLIEASNSLSIANNYYCSERIEEFACILIVSIMNSNLDEEQKKDCFRKFRDLLHSRAIAANN
jgi:hypothetical protein